MKTFILISSILGVILVLKMLGILEHFKRFFLGFLMMGFNSILSIILMVVIFKVLGASDVVEYAAYIFFALIITSLIVSGIYAVTDRDEFVIFSIYVNRAIYLISIIIGYIAGAFEFSAIRLVIAIIIMITVMFIYGGFYFPMWDHAQ